MVLCDCPLSAGNSQMGATIVDALDTLYVMGLHSEFKDGQEWVEQNLDFSVVRLALISSCIFHNFPTYLNARVFVPNPYLIHTCQGLVFFDVFLNGMLITPPSVFCSAIYLHVMFINQPIFFFIAALQN